jgi:hypothetical protein
MVLNRRQKSAARSQLKLTIEDTLDAGLPRAYTRGLYSQKCSAVFEYVYESYPQRFRRKSASEASLNSGSATLLPVTGEKKPDRQTVGLSERLRKTALRRVRKSPQYPDHRRYTW